MGFRRRIHPAAAPPSLLPYSYPEVRARIRKPVLVALGLLRGDDEAEDEHEHVGDVREGEDVEERAADHERGDRSRRGRHQVRGHRFGAPAGAMGGHHPRDQHQDVGRRPDDADRDEQPEVLVVEDAVLQVVVGSIAATQGGVAPDVGRDGVVVVRALLGGARAGQAIGLQLLAQVPDRARSEDVQDQNQADHDREHLAQRARAVGEQDDHARGGGDEARLALRGEDAREQQPGEGEARHPLPALRGLEHGHERERAPRG